MKNLIKIIFYAGLLLSGVIVSAQTMAQPLFRFGVIADVQYADLPDAGTRHYRKSPAKLAEAVDHFNSEEVAFVFSLGDFINDDLKGFDTLNAITSRLKMPVWHVAGNHDFDPEIPDYRVTMRLMGLKSLHYSFSVHGWRFIALNGNDISLYATKKDSKAYREAEQMLATLKEQGRPNAVAWNGGLGARQMKWLEKELSMAQEKNEKVILACHFPLYSSHDAGILWNAEQVIGLTEKYPDVFAYLSGHGHIYQHFSGQGVHHLMFRGMVEGIDNAYAVVSVYPGYIEVKDFGNTGGPVTKTYHEIR
jgi:manganese-dependent ADP-ribose/CDP-alcohol diphosphatase